MPHAVRKTPSGCSQEGEKNWTSVVVWMRRPLYPSITSVGLLKDCLWWWAGGFPVSLSLSLCLSHCLCVSVTLSLPLPPSVFPPPHLSCAMDQGEGSWLLLECHGCLALRHDAHRVYCPLETLGLKWNVLSVALAWVSLHNNNTWPWNYFKRETKTYRPDFPTFIFILLLLLWL